MKHLKEISAEKVERDGEMEDLVPEEFVFYIERNYIGLPMRRGQRKTPKYPHSFWNCYERLQEDRPRTTNDLEGYHRSGY